MWSEDPGRAPREANEEEREHEERRSRTSLSSAPLRWLFVFDGWRVDVDEDEFVLA